MFYVSLEDIHMAKEMKLLLVALERYLKEHSSIKTILLHLGNDEIGRGATAGIAGGLGERYMIIDSPAPNCKDVNDYLIQRVQRRRNKEVRAK